MKILKFGGTSLASTANRQQVIEIIKADLSSPCWVVVSAFAGMTDLLLSLAQQAAGGDEYYTDALQQFIDAHCQAAHQLLESPQPALLFIDEHRQLLANLLQGLSLIKTLSPNIVTAIMSFGELLSANIMSRALAEQLGGCEFIDARQLIKTIGGYQCAKVDFTKTADNIKTFYKTHQQLAVVTGFIASNVNDETTTLGRSGSDYTATIIAAALDAEAVLIYTDVDGVMTADPRCVPNARVLDQISYQEAMELSHFGATVIHPATMTPVIKQNIPLHIRNTFNFKHSGTLISNDQPTDQRIICGLSSQNDVALLTLQGPGLQGITGIASRLFGALAKADINIILISQASSEQSICFVISEADCDRAKEVVEDEFSLEIANELVAPIHQDRDVCIVAVVGDNMKQRIGIAGNLFRSLSKVRVNIIAIAQGASELNVSIVIHKKHESIALRALHAGFFEAKEPMQLFLFGATGLIGSKLLQQLADFQHPAIDLQLFGLANSKHMLCAHEALTINDITPKLEAATDSSIVGFVDSVKALSHLPKRVFVDCSANDEVVEHYASLLTEGIAIATPNKRANSGAFLRYQAIMHAASSINQNYHYETTVGAGLPIIQTVKNLVATADQLHSIEGVLSGSLNYIFSSFDGSQLFSQVVAEAQQRGYTEPDPLEDLSGLDVARKLLILLREWGYDYELKDINVQSVVSERGTIADYDAQLEEQRQAAAEQDCVLRYAAYFDGQQPTVGLKSYASNHPFYRLQGANNMLILTTDRYCENPLIIEGPGAGADVTAAGVLADILAFAATGVC